MIAIVSVCPAGLCPVSRHQRPRVAHTFGPCTPSLVRYTPVASGLASFVVVGRPLASINIPDFSSGDSSQLATRIPSMPSLSSLKVTSSSAFSVTIMSIARIPFAFAKKYVLVGLQRPHPGDRAHPLRPPEHVLRRLLENAIVLTGRPVRSRHQFARV